MKTIDADELIAALEDAHQSALAIMQKTHHYGLQSTYRTRAETFKDVIFIVRKLAKQADNVGELPY